MQDHCEGTASTDVSHAFDLFARKFQSEALLLSMATTDEEFDAAMAADTRLVDEGDAVPWNEDQAYFNALYGALSRYVEIPEGSNMSGVRVYWVTRRAFWNGALKHACLQARSEGNYMGSR